MGIVFAMVFLGSSAIMFVGVVVMGIMHWSAERKADKVALAAKSA